MLNMIAHSITARQVVDSQLQQARSLTTYLKQHPQDDEASIHLIIHLDREPATERASPAAYTEGRQPSVHYGMLDIISMQQFTGQY